MCCTKLFITICLLLLVSGCANNSIDRMAMFTAYNQALVNCGSEAGCIAATQSAMYSGAFTKPDDSIASVAVAMLPWGRLILDGIAIYRGASGSDSNGLIVNGSHNQFLGFNKSSADRTSTVSSPFDVTASPSLTQSWSDLYNVGKNQN